MPGRGCHGQLLGWAGLLVLPPPQQQLRAPGTFSCPPALPRPLPDPERPDTLTLHVSTPHSGPRWAWLVPVGSEARSAVTAQGNFLFLPEIGASGAGDSVVSGEEGGAAWSSRGGRAPPEERSRPARQAVGRSRGYWSFASVTRPWCWPSGGFVSTGLSALAGLHRGWGGEPSLRPHPPGQLLTCIHTDSWIFILPHSLGDPSYLVDLGSGCPSHSHRRDFEVTLVSSRCAPAFFFFFFLSTFLLSGTIRWAWPIPCGCGLSQETDHF